MENHLNEEVLIKPSDSDSININIIEYDDINTKPNTIKDTRTLGEKLDNTLNLINEFIYNTAIYLGDIYMVCNELFNPIRNFIKSIYVVKFKMP
jgi:hypothetical protein